MRPTESYSLQKDKGRDTLKCLAKITVISGCKWICPRLYSLRSDTGDFMLNMGKNFIKFTHQITKHINKQNDNDSPWGLEKQQ